MYNLSKPLLFALPPETAHEVSMTGLAAYGHLPFPIRPVSGRAQELFGLRFANPVGLAAGLDKDALAVTGLARLGFGFVEVGTVTPQPQPGNPSPRLFRLVKDGALINRMGFNNQGLAAMVPRLQRLREQDKLLDTRLGVNIGKNKVTELSAAKDDYLQCFSAVAPFADYITVNLSSPNTPGLRSLQSPESLRDLLEPLKELQQSNAQMNVPILVKIAPDLTGPDIGLVAQTLVALEIDGVIATNTTISRPDLHSVHRDEAGGLSGRPLTPLSRQVVTQLHQELDGRMPIVGVGGVSSVDDGAALMAAGASLVQIYTGFIYQGPNLVKALAREL